MAIPWPSILRPRTVSWTLENPSRTGGVSITGAEQVVASGASRWRCAMTIPAVREEWILSLRALAASLDGRAGEVEVPVFDVWTAADLRGARLSPEPTATFGAQSRAPLLFDLAGLSQSPTNTLVMAASASAGATRINVATIGPDGEPVDASWLAPRPGTYIGIGARLHIVAGAWRAAPGDAWTLDIRPRLRAAVASGARVATDWPVSTMRLAADDAARLELEFGRFGEASIEMVEAV